MEINLNSNLGIGCGNGDMRPIDAGYETKDASKVSDSTSLRISHLSSQPADLASSEPVASVPDAALVRDDALGNLVKSAFNLPPPPMPAFSDVGSV